MNYSLTVTRNWDLARKDLVIASSQGLFGPKSSKSVPLLSSLCLSRSDSPDGDRETILSLCCLENLFCSIPSGLYPLSVRNSPKFLSPKCYIENVPGRSGIMFHFGNYASDSRGCLLIGSRSVYDSPCSSNLTSLVSSTPAVKLFEDTVFPLIKDGSLTHVKIFDTPYQF